MKNILVVFFTLISIVGNAQEADSIAIKQVDSLIRISQTLTNNEDLDKALEINSIAEKIALEKLGNESAAYGRCCRNYNRVFFYKQDYAEAEKWCLKALAICEKIVGKDHGDYALILDNLATLSTKMLKYEKAERLYLESLNIREKVLGKEHPHYAGCLNNLAILYEELGNYEKAELLHLEAKDIKEKVLGKGHFDYAISLKNLANLYNAMGLYNKVEPLLLETEIIYENVLGKSHSEFAWLLNDFALHYHKMGNFKKAEQLHIECKEIREKVLGKEHPDYANSLNNLASVYYTIRNFKEAEQLYLEAKDIYEIILGKEDPNYAGSLYNLANVYAILGLYNKAELYYMEAKAIYEKVFGKEHPIYSQVLIGLGNLYMKQRNYEKAELLYLESKAIVEKILGKQHPDYPPSLIWLANLYESQSRHSESTHLLEESLYLIQAQMSRSVTFLSEEELSNYTASQENYKRMNSYLLGRPSGQTDKLPGLCYDNTLFHKGFIMQAAASLQRLAQSTPVAADIHISLKAIRRRIATELTKPVADQRELKELEERANIIEQQLVRTVSGYAEIQRQVKWQEVQAALPYSAVAVEFVHLQTDIIPNSDSSILYAALLLPPGNAQPVFISLFKEIDLIELLEKGQQRKSDYVNNLYSWIERDTNYQIESARTLTKLGGLNQSLYELIWKKIEEAGLKDVKTIYYAPSGILHRLNMAAFAINEQQLLSDRYNLIAVNSTRQIVAGLSDSSYKVGRNAIVYGGIQFEADTTGIIQKDESDFPLLATRSLAAVAEDTTLRGGTWQYLHWTQKEAEVISSTISKGGLIAEHRSGIDATEESFKTMGQADNPSPRVLHIATHGFFFPDPEQKMTTSPDDQSVFKWSDNPMIRSGLILAGGNYAWQNGRPVSPDKEDGILTAYEISQMNLSSTELVVLSACETGLGDIQGNEGVYGLQRAFKIAGAKYLIMSLWQVPDRETMEFMTTFYKNWLDSKMTIPDAFRKTQGEMRDRFGDVYSWGAFVLVE